MGKSDIFKHLSFRINSEYLAQLNTVKQRTATTSSKVKKNEWMSHKNGKKKLKTIRQLVTARKMQSFRRPRNWTSTVLSMTNILQYI